MCRTSSVPNWVGCLMSVMGVLILAGWAGAGASQKTAYVPWDALIDDPNLGPNWQLSPEWATYLYSIDGGAYPLAFGLARTDGGPRGLNALKLVVDGNDTGHHETTARQGFFDVINTGDNNTFTDLLLMIAVDAGRLNESFGLTLATDVNTVDGSGHPYEYVFDPQADFVYYDPCRLGYDTGRPSGLYWNTIPDYEPTTYLYNQGMISIYALKKVNLAPGTGARIYYSFTGLDCRAVFNVYGSVQKKDKSTGLTVTQVYHTNRAVADPNDPAAQVSTFAVIPPRWILDLDGNGCVNFADMDVIGTNLGRPVDDTTEARLRLADVDGNGLIDWEDVTTFVAMTQTMWGDE